MGNRYSDITSKMFQMSRTQPSFELPRCLSIFTSDQRGYNGLMCVHKYHIYLVPMDGQSQHQLSRQTLLSAYVPRFRLPSSTLSGHAWWWNRNRWAENILITGNKPGCFHDSTTIICTDPLVLTQSSVGWRRREEGMVVNVKSVRPELRIQFDIEFGYRRLLV